MDSNHRPSGYEPDELPLLHAATVADAMVAHTRPLPLICSRCIDLVSQGVIPPVPSALRRCTTRFGMERGGSSALKTHLKPSTQGTPPPIYAFCDVIHVSLFVLNSLPACPWVVGVAHHRQVLLTQASPRSSVGVGSSVRTPSTAPLFASSSCWDLTSLTLREGSSCSGLPT